MSDSFIYELPLQANPEQENVLRTRFGAGGHLYNGCLGEALRRLDLARQSQDWQKAKKLPRSKERTEYFQKAIKRYQCFKNGKIVWNKLTLKPLYDLKDKERVEAHALAHKTKYVRLVRRNLRGKPLFYAQLIQEGKSFLKKRHTIGKGKTIGLDIGPSTIAIVGEKTAALNSFCSELQENEKQIKTLQKALDRSRRATNPGNYDEKGIPLKNTAWKYSKRYFKKRQKLSEQKRVVAATRKTLHGTYANQLVSLADTIKTEKLSYQSFQKHFGKSVTQYAPGIFMQILRRKAENAGGQVIEFSPYDTKLSQTCHGCGEIKKKPLSQRWHRCSCGVEAQRDLYSAFLALHVDKESLDRTQAISAWASAGPLLQQTLSRLEQTAKGKQRLACFGLSQRQSYTPVEDGSAASEVRDDVPGTMRFRESFEELECLAIRTP